MKNSQHLVALVLTLLLLGASAARFGGSKSASPMICNLSQDDLMACKPACTKAAAAAAPPVDPNTACCGALAKADLTCLCGYKDSMVLPLYGIDPSLAMQLPTKCGLTPPATC